MAQYLEADKNLQHTLEEPRNLKVAYCANVLFHIDSVIV